MLDLDPLLAALARAPADPRLAQIESRVAVALVARRRSGLQRRSLFAVTALALAIGVVGGGLQSASTRAQQTPSPFDAALALAPATLLAGLS